jgi:hypothetical protein
MRFTRQGTSADRPRLNAKMFEAAQLAQGSLTAQQIAQSAARLGAGDSKASAALRNLQDRQRERFQLLAERDTLVAEGGRAADRLAEMDKRITTADQALAEAESQVQAAVPKYNKKIPGRVLRSGTCASAGHGRSSQFAAR